MTRQPTTTRAAGTPAKALNQDSLPLEVEALLEAFTDQYTSLAKHTEAQRQAIRTADHAGIGLAAAAQTTTVTALAHLEQRRRELVAAACTRFPTLASKRSTTITLTDLCNACREADRPRLVRKAADLKALVSQVDTQTRTIKAATASLLAHMEGLMRQVSRQLSHAGTYTAKGFVHSPAHASAVVSALDLCT